MLLLSAVDRVAVAALLERYGLKLPGTELAPNRGPEHRHRCLAALALYGIDAPAPSGAAHAGARPRHARA